MKKIEKPILSVFTDITFESFPECSDILVLFHSAMESKHPDISYADAVVVYNEYLERGNTYEDLVLLILKLLKL